MTRRRRGRGLEWPRGLDRFTEADWPSPATGDDPGAKGLLAMGAEQWLAEVLPLHSTDPGLAAAWRRTFAFRRFARAREDFLGEDHPLHIEAWIDHVQAEREIVQAYVMRRDGL